MTVEERGFITNRRGKRLFHALHMPAESASAWIFCNPFLEEKVFSHSVYVEFARFLSSNGHAVIRFDYEGDGDSEGDIRDMDLASWTSDAEDMAGVMRSRIPDVPLNFFGLRFGAIVAALATRGAGGRGMLLWDPVLEGERYFDECLKINLTTQLATYKKVVDDRKQMLARLRDGGTVNISGYEIGKGMYESLASSRLPHDVRPGEHDVSVIAINRPGSKNMHDNIALLVGGRKEKFTICECLQFWYEPRFINSQQDELFSASLSLIRSSAMTAA
jgi:hypothetical protein